MALRNKYVVRANNGIVRKVSNASLKLIKIIATRIKPSRINNPITFTTPSEIKSSGIMASQNVTIAPASTAGGSIAGSRRGAWALNVCSYHDANGNTDNTRSLKLLGEDPASGAQYADTDIIFARHAVKDFAGNNGWLALWQVEASSGNRFVVNNGLVAEIYIHAATTEGIKFSPSEVGITLGLPPSITATQELVVPRSIPIILDIINLLFLL